MKHLFEFRKKSAEQVSQRIFYILIALAVLVFGLFFLVGYDMPFEENPDFTAPLFTDVLIGLMWLFLVGGIGLAIYSMWKDYRGSRSEAVVNGVLVRRIFRITWIACSPSWCLPSHWVPLPRCSSMARIMRIGFGSNYPICLSSHRS